MLIEYTLACLLCIIASVRSSPTRSVPVPGPTDDPSRDVNECSDYKTCHRKGEGYWWELQAVLGQEQPKDKTDGGRIFEQNYGSEIMILDSRLERLTRIRPDIEGHGYNWKFVEAFGTFSKDATTGRDTEATAYVNMFHTSKGLVVGVENFRKLDEQETLPYSEIIYHIWQVVRKKDDFFKTLDPEHPGGGPISTIQAMVQIDVQNDESQGVLRAIWIDRHLEWNEGDGNWYKFAVTETADYFYALLGTVNVKGALFLLKHHAVEIGRKTITEIYVRWPWVNPDIWIVIGPNTPVAGAISTS